MGVVINVKAAGVMANTLANWHDIDGDREFIKGAVDIIGHALSRLSKQLGSTGAVEKFIEIGQQYIGLRRQLKENKGTNRIGWLQMFKEREKFGIQHNQQNANKLMKIATTLSKSTLSELLPTSWQSLYLIATAFGEKHQEKLSECLKDKRITPLSTEAEVRKLAKELGLIKEKKTQPKQNKVRLLHKWAESNIKKATEIGANKQDKLNMIRTLLEEWDYSPKEI